MTLYDPRPCSHCLTTATEGGEPCAKCTLAEWMQRYHPSTATRIVYRGRIAEVYAGQRLEVRADARFARICARTYALDSTVVPDEWTLEDVVIWAYCEVFGHEHEGGPEPTPETRAWLAHVRNQWEDVVERATTPVYRERGLGGIRDIRQSAESEDRLALLRLAHALTFAAMSHIVACRTRHAYTLHGSDAGKVMARRILEGTL